MREFQIKIEPAYVYVMTISIRYEEHEKEKHN